ncbi:MAG: maleylpyruvate isomerase N-terminal domain-containing protein [Dehalococcoidia bacterium]
MNRVVRVFAERAVARRESLLELVSVVPEDSWSRNAPGEPWDAFHHLAHALSADNGVSEVLPAFTRTAARTIPVVELLSRRESTIESAVALDLDQLLAQGAAARRQVLVTLEDLEQSDLECAALFIDQRSPWSQPAPITLFAYLEQWSHHDAEHEAAIRAAISTPPDLSAVAHTRRLR